MIAKGFKMVSPVQNAATTQMLMDEWKLGPEKTSIKPDANKAFWADLAKAWKVDEKEARRRFCANCEYFNNTPEMQKLMESVPLTRLDMDGGGRGYCHKFDFICHNLRVCQAWEEKPYEMED